MQDNQNKSYKWVNLGYKYFRILEFVYNEITQGAMRGFYTRLGEKDRRHYAALEAIKLGHGGATYISRLLSVGRSTIIKGKKELMASSPAGPSRKAGSPTDELVYWMCLNPWQIAEVFYEQHHTRILPLTQMGRPK